MVAVLTPKSGGKSIVIDKAVVLVGRHPDCDYILQNSRKVSRRHVCLVQVNEKYMVRDLGSMNGVTVNGTRVKNEQRVVIGDEIVIGDVHFRFEEVQKIPRPPRKPPAVPKPTAAPPEPVEPKRNGNGLIASGVPADISQEYPVAIPDEDQSFAVSQDDPSVMAEVDHPVLLPDPLVSDDDDVDFIALDDDIDAKFSADVPPVQEVEVIDDLDVVDTIDEPGPTGSVDSFEEFAPIVDIVDEFVDEADVDDVIVLDDPVILDDDEDEFIVLD